MRRASRIFTVLILTLLIAGAFNNLIDNDVFIKIASANPDIQYYNSTDSGGVGEDAMLSETVPTYNSGGKTNVQVKSYSTNTRTIIYFDLSSFPSYGSITSATLKLYYYEYIATGSNPSGRTYNIHRVIADWDEGDDAVGSASGNVTWNDRKTSTPWTTAGGDYDATATDSDTVPASAGAWMEWNVTADVSDFLDSTYTNYGWIIKDTSEDSATKYVSNFYSSEYTDDTSKTPRLVIEYTPADTSPPTPNPMTWSVNPDDASTTSIDMTATTASDSTPPIYYYFDYYDSPTGGTGGTDSGWQNADTTYTDTGLQENHQYRYRVKAKDSASTPNEGSYSSILGAYTAVGAPTSTEFSIDNNGTTWINMSVAVPPNYNQGITGCQFEGVTGTPPSSGWITGSTNYSGGRWYYNATGLSEGTTYGFKVRFRNGDGDTTAYTAEETGTTLTSESWNLIESWNGTLYNSSSWNLIESWNGTLYNSSSWNIAETWNGSLYNSSSWHIVQTWNGSLHNSSSWNTIDTWNGVLWNGTTWSTIETWNGSIYNTSSWHLIGTWNGTLYNQQKWNIVAIWNGTLYNSTTPTPSPSYTFVIESILLIILAIFLFAIGFVISIPGIKIIAYILSGLFFIFAALSFENPLFMGLSALLGVIIIMIGAMTAWGER